MRVAGVTGSFFLSNVPCINSGSGGTLEGLTFGRGVGPGVLRSEQFVNSKRQIKRKRDELKLQEVQCVEMR